jgi:transcriptional regulator|tara:strand:+ start:1394 stop:1588 length:195 start_codon:yes stop_codon:yes gene_type:complete
MIILNAWYGRLGNNIRQLSNIIDIAIAYKHNIKINVKKLNYFDLSVIEKCFNKYNNNEIKQKYI